MNQNETNESLESHLNDILNFSDAKVHSIQTILEHLNDIYNKKTIFLRFIETKDLNFVLGLINKLKLFYEQIELSPFYFYKLFKIRMWLLTRVNRHQTSSILIPHKWQFPLCIKPGKLFSKKMVFILPKNWSPQEIEKNINNISIRVQLSKFQENDPRRDTEPNLKFGTLCYTDLKYNKTKHQLSVIDCVLKIHSKQTTYECYSLTFQAFAPFFDKDNLINSSKTFFMLSPDNPSIIQSFEWYFYLSKFLIVQEIIPHNMIQQFTIWCARHLSQDCKLYQLSDLEFESCLSIYKQFKHIEVVFGLLTKCFKLLDFCPLQIKSLYLMGMLFFAEQDKVQEFLCKKKILGCGMIFMDKQNITKISWFMGETKDQFLFKFETVDLSDLESLSFFEAKFGISSFFKFDRLKGNFYVYHLNSFNLTQI